MSRSFLRLDNAALIFPAIRRRDWINVFRQSVTLQEPVDPEIMRAAGCNPLKCEPSAAGRI